MDKTEWEDTKMEIVYVGIGLGIGFVVQFVGRSCIRYIERKNCVLDSTKSDEHDPLIVKPDKKINPLYKIWIIRKLRGGLTDPITLLTVGTAIIKVGTVISEVSPTIGLLLGFGSFLMKTKKANIVSMLYKTSPQNLPVKSLISIQDKMNAIENIGHLCDNHIGEIIINILNSDSLSIEQKQKAIYKIFTEHIRLDTNGARVKFVLCIFTILVALYIGDTTGYIIVLKSLYNAVKEGKLNSRVFLTIIKKLRKKGWLVDPYLFD